MDRSANVCDRCGKLITRLDSGIPQEFICQCWRTGAPWQQVPLNLVDQLDYARKCARAWKAKAKEYRARFLDEVARGGRKEDYYYAEVDKLLRKIKKLKKKVKRAKQSQIIPETECVCGTVSYTTDEWTDMKLFNPSDIVEINSKDWITDGFGKFVPYKCPQCGGKRQVIRPGDIRCGECGS